MQATQCHIRKCSSLGCLEQGRLHGGSISCGGCQRKKERWHTKSSLTSSVWSTGELVMCDCRQFSFVIPCDAVHLLIWWHLRPVHDFDAC